MLVDDEPRILSALRRSLRREGYEIVLAANGREALAELEGRAFDLVVSDQKMPGLSGARLLAQIAERWPGTARMLLSGWPGEIAPEDLAAARVHAVMSKPWEEEMLKETIRAALRWEPASE